MPVRNHIVRIMPAAGVAKGTEEVTEQAKADILKPEPSKTEAAAFIKKATIEEANFNIPVLEDKTKLK